MARQYSPRNFLRQTSNALLDRYFHDRGLLTGLDIESLAEAEVEPIFEAWEALPAARRAEVDSDFAVVDSVADEQGILTLLEEASFQNLDLISAFEEFEGFHDKALWTFLEHRRVVEIAARFREADQLPKTYWNGRREGVPASQPRDDDHASNELSEALASYFRLMEGRGHECQVDVYRRGDRFYYFAFPEDYGRAPLEYTAGRLERRPQRPVFEVVFVYKRTVASLDTFFRGRKKATQELESIFSRVVLQAELEAATDDKIYNLNAFKNRNLPFVYDPSSGIQDVSVRFLRLSLFGGGKKRLTFEADPKQGKGAIYDLIDSAFGHSGNGASGGLSLTLANVTRVGIRATFASEGRGRAPTKTFYLTFPNGCTLSHEGRDAVLRQMLIDSKIEPVAPAAAAAEG